MHQDMELPPPKVMQQTLTKVTERLAMELVMPAAVAPEWSALEWQLARAVAAIHGVSPLLATRLRWQGPPGWSSFLQTQRAHVRARHLQIEALLHRIDARAREEATALIALKGAALHSLGLYQPGDRPMADVDLLVPPNESRRAADVLHSLGFGLAYANWKHLVFMPEAHGRQAAMGEHAHNYLKIELHERIAEAFPLRITDVTDSVLSHRLHPGLNPYPSKAALMIHLLIHAAGCMTFRALRLLHLHDIAAVATQMEAADWQQLLEQQRKPGGAWWALPPLQLTVRYFTDRVPQEVLAALVPACPAKLRHLAQRQSLSDLSLSYPWIEAFPGIGWSRSLAETIQYIGSRVRPSKEVLQLRKVALDTQVADGQSQWGHLSQLRRILRWVTSRQTRPDTLHAVRMALTQPL